MVLHIYVLCFKYYIIREGIGFPDLPHEGKTIPDPGVFMTTKTGQSGIYRLGVQADTQKDEKRRGRKKLLDMVDMLSS